MIWDDQCSFVFFWSIFFFSHGISFALLILLFVHISLHSVFDIFHTSLLYILLAIRYILFVIIDIFILDSFFLLDTFISNILGTWILRFFVHITFYTWGYEILSLGLLSLVSFHSSLYYPILRYIPSLKTTLRPWYHTLCFDGSHVGDTWDRLVSILIMMVQELWYDPTLGHSHLREFVGYATTLFDVLHWGIPFLASYGFLRRQFISRHAHSLEEIRHPLHISM